MLNSVSRSLRHQPYACVSKGELSTSNFNKLCEVDRSTSCEKDQQLPVRLPLPLSPSQPSGRCDQHSSVVEDQSPLAWATTPEQQWDHGRLLGLSRMAWRASVSKNLQELRQVSPPATGLNTPQSSAASSKAYCELLQDTFVSEGSRQPGRQVRSQASDRPIA